MSVRQVLVDAIKDRLESTITIENGYGRSVTNRVYNARTPPQVAAKPCVFILQEEETLPQEAGRRSFGYVERVLRVSLLFAEDYAGSDADEKALDFLAEVQRAMGDAMTIQAPLSAGGTTPLDVSMQEAGNFVNGGTPLKGAVYGQITYDLHYRTSDSDPRYIR